VIRFIGWRILLTLFVAVAIIFFVHLGMRMMESSAAPRNDIFAQSRSAWQETRSFIADAVEGDFGTITTNRGRVPAKQILIDTYINSMGLLGTALAVAVVVGVIAGSIAALSKRVPLSTPIMAFTIIGISAPSFFVALLLQFGEIKWVQIFGYPLVSVGGFGWDFRHMLLPVLVLTARPVAYLTRATFLGLNRVMSEDYIRTAWAKGLSPRWIYYNHTLRNVAVPLLTAGGVSLRFALASLPVVEYFFGWPGMGDRLLSAIRAGQTPVVVTLALALGLTFVVINVLLDISYGFIDPRLKES
jgi:ABC-type dipeptide/oligopeptide/nickel transport system permease component